MCVTATFIFYILLKLLQCLLLSEIFSFFPRFFFFYFVMAQNLQKPFPTFHKRYKGGTFNLSIPSPAYTSCANK